MQQIMGQDILNNNDMDDVLVSHQLSNDLRELYDLPSINIPQNHQEQQPQLSAKIITNLNGFLKDYATDSEENSVDVVKYSRSKENIS
jgi:hypothetical protein